MDEKLEAKLGLFDATAISIGAIVGAGIFVVTGIASGLAGSALPVSMAFASLIALFTALSFAELSSWQPREGSIYEYAYQLISPFTGFLTGWMWIASNVFTGAAVAMGLAEYLHTVIPALPIRIVAVAACIAFSALNFLGIKQSSLLNNILVVAKLLILGFFASYGFLHLKLANFADFNPFHTGVLYGAFIIFFAYGGFARVAVIAEEVKDAEKNVPRAILLSLAISTIMYILVGIAAVGLAGADKLAESGSPLADALKVAGNPYAIYIVSCGGLIATASVLLTSILGVSRMAYSMARRRDLPSFLMKIHGRYGTPYYAIWSACAFMIFLDVFVDLSRLVAIGTFTMLFYYLIANVSAWRLKTEARLYSKAVPILGAVSCLTLMGFTIFYEINAWIVGLSALSLGVAAYMIKQRLFLRAHVSE